MTIARSILQAATDYASLHVGHVPTRLRRDPAYASLGSVVGWALWRRRLHAARRWATAGHEHPERSRRAPAAPWTAPVPDVGNGGMSAPH